MRNQRDKKQAKVLPLPADVPTLSEWITLLELSPETARQDSAYQKLTRNASYRAARAALMRLRPDACEIGFVQMLANWLLGVYWDRLQSSPPRRGDSRSRKNAARAAAYLLKQEDCALADPHEHRQLVDLLGKLQRQIEGTPRKRYERRDAAQLTRSERLNLALMLIAELDVRSPAIIEHIGAMLDKPCDRRTAQYTVRVNRHEILTPDRRAILTPRYERRRRDEGMSRYGGGGDRRSYGF